MNDGTHFFMMNFHHFANIRKAMNIKKRFKIMFTFFYSSNDISWHWVPILVGKILKYLWKNLLSYMVSNQNMVKFSYGWSWRRLQNWKNEKIWKIINAIIINIISNSFIYLVFKWNI